MKIKQYSTYTAFFDMLFNLVLLFVCLFMLSFVLMNERNIQTNLKTKAEYTITVTWPESTWEDVDTWIQLPNNQLVWYKQKDRGLVHLDRDDRGSIADTYQLQDGSKATYPFNQEIVTFRGVMEGEYVVNIHLYSCYTDTPDVEVTIIMNKLNPKFKTENSKVIRLTKSWQEVTVFRFYMHKDGSITFLEPIQTNLVEQKLSKRVDQANRDARRNDGTIY